MPSMPAPVEQETEEATTEPPTKKETEAYKPIIPDKDDEDDDYKIYDLGFVSVGLPKEYSSKLSVDKESRTWGD